MLQGVLHSVQGQVDYFLGKGISTLELEGFVEHNPHGSYTGAMSYEQELAGPICESITPLL